MDQHDKQFIQDQVAEIKTALERHSLAMLAAAALNKVLAEQNYAGNKAADEAIDVAKKTYAKL